MYHSEAAPACRVQKPGRARCREPPARDCILLGIVALIFVRALSPVLGCCCYHASWKRGKCPLKRRTELWNSMFDLGQGNGSLPGTAWHSLGDLGGGRSRFKLCSREMC